MLLGLPLLGNSHVLMLVISMQVEIMMALEEKFDITLDEEGGYYEQGSIQHFVRASFVYACMYIGAIHHLCPVRSSVVQLMPCG